jgi:hypothetical protein
LLYPTINISSLKAVDGQTTGQMLFILRNGYRTFMERPMRLLEVKKIWARAPHNAFPDLIRFNGCWFCVFREAQGHVSDDGKLRVIRSKDGSVWTSVALLEWKAGDLREAKFSISANNQLMLCGAVRFLEPLDGNKHQSVTWMSSDGERWSEPFCCPTGLGTWRWGVTWHKGAAYSFGYGGKDRQGCLYRSEDGKNWSVLKDEAYPDVQSYGNETSVVFREDDTAFCLLRRDRGSCSAMLGVSLPPYTEWVWNDLQVYIGGPKMIPFSLDRFLAGVRLYGEEPRTSICWIYTTPPGLVEALELPSAGDTSYPGLVLQDDVLWVSYYSSHEDETSIYLARVKVTA